MDHSRQKPRFFGVNKVDIHAKPDGGYESMSEPMGESMVTSSPDRNGLQIARCRLHRDSCQIELR